MNLYGWIIASVQLQHLPCVVAQERDRLLEDQFGRVVLVEPLIHRDLTGRHLLVPGNRITVDDLFLAVAPEVRGEVAVRDREKQNLLAALDAANGRVWGPEGAAALLGISPSTLSYRMNAFGIEKAVGSGRR